MTLDEQIHELGRLGVLSQATNVPVVLGNGDVVSPGIYRLGTQTPNWNAFMAELANHDMNLGVLVLPHTLPAQEFERYGVPSLMHFATAGTDGLRQLVGHQFVYAPQHHTNFICPLPRSEPFPEGTLMKQRMAAYPTLTRSRRITL